MILESDASLALWDRYRDHMRECRDCQEPNEIGCALGELRYAVWEESTRNNGGAK